MPQKLPGGVFKGVENTYQFSKSFEGNGHEDIDKG